MYAIYLYLDFVDCKLSDELLHFAFCILHFALEASVTSKLKKGSFTINFRQFYHQMVGVCRNPGVASCQHIGMQIYFRFPKGPDQHHIHWKRSPEFLSDINSSARTTTKSHLVSSWYDRALATSIKHFKSTDP